jgi:hypothetical protein
MNTIDQNDYSDSEGTSVCLESIQERDASRERLAESYRKWKKAQERKS